MIVAFLAMLAARGTVFILRVVPSVYELSPRERRVGGPRARRSL